MAKYRQKSEVVEAVQLLEENLDEMHDHAQTGWLLHGEVELDRDRVQLLIPTLGGLEIASETDWVILGVTGELYLCKSDIFKATYEKVE